ncbi:hypothetical protein PO909_016672 [Leuciscus waleckii]
MLSPSNAAIGELPSYKASIKNKNGARARLHNFIFLILCFTGGDDGDVSSQAAPPGDVSPALSRPWPGQQHYKTMTTPLYCRINLSVPVLDGFFNDRDTT